MWGGRRSGHRGRGRGHHGRGRGAYDSANGSEDSGSNSYRGGPPRGLRGRDIGMFYANRSRRAQKEIKENFPVLSMDESLQQYVKETLDSLACKPGSFRETQKDTSENLAEDLLALDRLEEMEDSEFKRMYKDNIDKNQQKDTMTKTGPTPSRLVSNQTIDNRLREELERKSESKIYQEMLKARQNLPSYTMKKTILEAINNNQVVVLSGETGCGKTTQVPQFVLDDAIGSGQGSTCRIVCTQPRRISAISIAKRVADERAETLGKSVGYQIRLEAVSPRDVGSVTYCTTGIVLRWLQSDPELLGISHLILDEVHERDTLSDFLICISRDLLPRRPDLKIILMSATLNAEQFSQYFGESPMLHIPGFTFPVQEYYLEDVLEKLRFSYQQTNSRYGGQRDGRRANKSSDFEEKVVPVIHELSTTNQYSRATIRELLKPESEEISIELIYELILHITRMPPGAVLVFLPGWAQISDLNDMLQAKGTATRMNLSVHPLHSLMPTVNQSQVFDPPPKGIRKVILATNIAETSITINDIVYVIDCGKIKLTNYNKETNVSTLLPEWVSRANARQRRGRSGRVQEGICYHLFTRARENLLQDFALPEIQRTRLEEVLLMVKILKLGLCKPFLTRVLEPPDSEVLETSLKLLRSISALDTAENLTPLGYHLARLPMDPLIGKMLIMGAIFSCLDPILTITASLSFKDPFVIPLSKEQLVDKRKEELDDGVKSDHILLATVYNGWERSLHTGTRQEYIWQNFLSGSVLHQIKNLRQQFMKILYDHKFTSTTNPMAEEVNRSSNNTAVVRSIIAAGLYPNVGRILVNDRDQMKSIEADGLRVEIHPKSVNSKSRSFQGRWLMYWMCMKSSKIYLHDTTMVFNFPLVFFGANLGYDDNKKLMLVDDVVKFKCRKSVYDIVKRLRMELNVLLEYKVSHPNVTTCNLDTSEGKILQLIMDIISEETH